MTMTTDMLLPIHSTLILTRIFLMTSEQTKLHYFLSTTAEEGKNLWHNVLQLKVKVSKQTGLEDNAAALVFSLTQLP